MKRECPNCGKEIPIMPSLKNFGVAHYSGVSPSGIIRVCPPAVKVGAGKEIPESKRIEIWEDDLLWEDL